MFGDLLTPSQCSALLDKSRSSESGLFVLRKIGRLRLRGRGRRRCRGRCCKVGLQGVNPVMVLQCALVCAPRCPLMFVAL